MSAKDIFLKLILEFSSKWEEDWRELEEYCRTWEEVRRRMEEERREETAWKAMQSKPTVDQINEMNWFPVCHKWCNIGESLGISKGVMEDIIRTAGLFIEIYHNSLCDSTLCIKAMLIKWLNEDQGTGNSKRTWITIAKAVKNAGLGEVVFELLEEVTRKFKQGYSLLWGTPTWQELKDTIVHHLGEEWHSVADSLGMSPKVKEEISSKFGSVPTQCSEAMFSKWLNHEEGTGHKERTWETVLTALEDAGRGDLAFSVVDKLTVKHKEEEALKKAPNIKEIEFLVIPHMARMWRAIGRFLGIIKAILTAIESEARKKVSLKQTCEMFQLWLDGREGTGDEERSWLVILRVLVDIGRSDIIFEIQEHFDLKTKDIDRALSLLCESTQSSLDGIIPIPTTSTPVPTTSQGIADTASLVTPPLTNNIGQVSLHDCIEDDGEVEEDKGCCSKSLSESSGSEVYTDPLPRLGSKRSCSEGSMGESSLATVEETTSTHHPPQSNGGHFTWSEPKRRRLEEVSDDEHRDVIRKHWTRCMEGLDCAVIKDHLWDSHLITYSDRKRIKQAVSTEDANEVVLDRLYTSATPLRLLEFAQLLQTREPLAYSRNVKIGKEIESSLMEIVENTS